MATKAKQARGAGSAAGRSNGNGSSPPGLAIEVPPTALKDPHRIELLVGMLRQIEAQAFEIEMVMAANGHSRDDLQPGGVATYGQAIHEKRAQIQRLRESVPDLIDAVDEHLRGS